MGLRDVIGVRNLAKNLISVKKICERGGRILFTKERALVKNKQGQTIAIASIYNNLYRIHLQNHFPQVLNVYINTWHRRLGSFLDKVSGMSEIYFLGPKMKPKIFTSYLKPS